MGSYLTRQTTVPTSEKTFTFSTWMKVSGRTGADNGIIEWYRDSNNRHQILIDSTTSKLRVRSLEVGSLKVDIHSDAVFRDPSAWYHICIHSDNTQASASNRFKLWVNGVAQTFSTYTWSFNQGVNINVYDGTSGDAVNVGTKSESTSNSFDGCLADTYYIDGYTIAHTEFGQTDSTSGIWKPNTSPTISSYGNAGFHLTYEDSSNLGDDTSGNSKDMTSVGTITQNVDNPSNNFATGNPLYFTNSAWTTSLSNGNLTLTGHTGSNSYPILASTLAASSGKFYAEFKVTSSSQNFYCGVATPEAVSETSINAHYPNWDNEGGSNAHAYSIYGADGQKYVKENGGATSASSYASTTSQNDIIGVALDLDNNKLYFSKNGTWQNSGDPTSGSTGTGAIPISLTSNTGYWFMAANCNSASNTAVWSHNYGNGYFGSTAVSSAGTNASNNGIFEYDVPAGYQALCTKGLNA